MSVRILADPGSTWRIPGEPWEKSKARLAEIVTMCVSAGADGIKAQLLRKGMYREGTKAAALVGQYEMPEEWLPWLEERCGEYGIDFLCTAYRVEDVAVVDPYVLTHKVASFDLGNDALLEAIARTHKPVILSTGLGTWKRALHQVVTHFPGLQSMRVTLLHCVTQYPSPLESMNLAALKGVNWDDGRMKYGLSDHSMTNTAAIMAVALGASVIERHVRAHSTPLTNPDYAAAFESGDFYQYVADIREAEKVLGDGVKRLMDGEWVNWQYDPTTGRRGGD